MATQEQRIVTSSETLHNLYVVPLDAFLSPPPQEPEVYNPGSGVQVTRLNFVSYIMDSLKRSRGVHEAQNSYYLWHELHGGFDSLGSIRNMISAGGAKSMSLQEKQMFADAYRSIKAHETEKELKDTSINKTAGHFSIQLHGIIEYQRFAGGIISPEHVRSLPNWNEFSTVLNREVSYAKFRRKLRDLVATKQFGAVAELPGFTLVGEAKLERRGEYVFGPNPDSYKEAGTIMEKYTEVTEPQKNDLAFYFKDTEKGQIFTHIGIVQGVGIVRSRIDNNAPVFDHPTRSIPYDYGFIIRYFRKPEDRELLHIER